MSATLFYSTLVGIVIGLIVAIWSLRSFAKRHGKTLGQIIALAIAHLMRFFPAYEGTGAIIGLTVGIGAGSAGLGVASLMAGPPLLALVIVMLKIQIASTRMASTKAALIQALGAIDYYWVDALNGIALCARSRQIAVVPAAGASAKRYDLKAIRGAAAIQPASDRIQATGTGGILGQNARFEAAQANLEARLTNLRQTGLELRLDDLQLPSLFIAMSYRGAEQWLLLLAKAGRGELAPNDRAQQLPT